MAEVSISKRHPAREILEKTCATGPTTDAWPKVAHEHGHLAVGHMDDYPFTKSQAKRLADITQKIERAQPD
jgi:hypothetical protein